jgi:phosphate acyltransferase
VRIALDAMGTDRAPAVEVAGAVAALGEFEESVHLVLVGDPGAIETELAQYPNAPLGRLEVVPAPERIAMSEAPTQAVRRKPNSSVVVGLSLHRDREVDAFVSAGSTGAVMAGSLLFLRRLPGVDRPAVGTPVPTTSGHTLVIDAGANIETRPHHLLQFAHLGTIYAQDLMGKPKPRVGLLNIGEEPEKGDDRAVETFGLLSTAQHLHFVGNVEGRDIIRGKCDVLVCDGFVGNVLLKFYESVAEFIIGLLKKELAASGAEMDLKRVFQLLDYTEYGGAPLLGVNGVTIICHGGSPPRAIHNALRVAHQAVESGMVAHIERQLARLNRAIEGT